MAGFTTVEPNETFEHLLTRVQATGLSPQAARKALLDANPHLGSTGEKLKAGNVVVVPFEAKGHSVRTTTNRATTRVTTILEAITRAKASAPRKPAILAELDVDLTNVPDGRAEAKELLAQAEAALPTFAGILR